MLGPLAPLDPFVRTAWSSDLPQDALQVMRLCAFDWAICGLAVLGSGERVTDGMLDYAAASRGGPASVFYTKDLLARGGPDRLPAREAALVNGTIGHALDVDDTHFAHIGHVSTVVMPAALAVAETYGRSFDDMIRAARIGAEVAVRVGQWLGRSHYQAGWHQTATAGAYGAAVAASCLIAGSERVPFLPAAILNVAGMASGLKAQFGSAMKPVNAGLAAANGVEAALMAKAGLTGSPDVLGAVLATQAGEGDPTAFDGLGTQWRFDAVSHKYHACCHGTHAMLEALTVLNLPRGAPITRIEVRTHPRWMSVCNKPQPTTWLEGKFSYRFLAALYLAGQDSFGPGPDLYFPIDDSLQARMDMVEVIEDARLSETACALRVETTDNIHEVTHDIGTAEPLEERLRKLTIKGEALLRRGVTQQLLAAIDARDLAAYTKTLRRI